MPRLAKGGKWTYGWVVVGCRGDVLIPREAWQAYGFQDGGEAIFLPGSTTSGGFGISTPALLAEARRSARSGKLRVQLAIVLAGRLIFTLVVRLVDPQTTRASKVAR